MRFGLEHPGQKGADPVPGAGFGKRKPIGAGGTPHPLRGGRQHGTADR